jgi:hypothetical protein
MSKTSDPATQPVRLFCVTLEWPGADEGNFCESVWATDGDEAIRLVATAMADGEEWCTDEERDEWISDVVGEAGAYAAEDVGVRVLSDLRELLQGPDRDAAGTIDLASLTVASIRQALEAQVRTAVAAAE